MPKYRKASKPVHPATYLVKFGEDEHYIYLKIGKDNPLAQEWGRRHNAQPCWLNSAWLVVDSTAQASREATAIMYLVDGMEHGKPQAAQTLRTAGYSEDDIQANLNAQA